MAIYLKTVEFKFPFGGVHESSAISEQPDGTTPFAQNVRGYDVASGRDVGCQRPRLSSLAPAWSQTNSIDGLFSGFIDGTETVLALTNGGAYCGNATDSGVWRFGGLSNPSASAYTSSSIIGLAFAYGSFWISDDTLPLRKASPGSGVTFPAATAGSLPTGATILALYRGRLFHAGFASDPYNYIASKSGDPLDYNYSSTSQAGAFAGNDTPQAGLIGERITALIPYGDVSMVMGMESSLAVMRGDPKAGGRIDFLSRQVGILSNTAWCQSPDGSLFFMGTDGLYVLRRPDGEPKNISRGRLDRTLGRVNFATTDVLMGWDPFEQGVKIYLAPRTIGADPIASVYAVFWEQRKDAFWVDLLGTSRNIVARSVTNIRENRSLVFGTAGGYIARYSNESPWLDGSMVSNVAFPIVSPFGNQVMAKTIGIRILWGDPATNGTSGFAARWAMIGENDPVDAYSGLLSVPNFGTGDASGTVSLGGYQTLDRSRVRGSALLFQVGNNATEKTWQIERVTAQVAPSGRVRA